MIDAGLIVAALAGFGLTHRFGVALLLYGLIGTLRSIISPLYATWFNLRIDAPQVRATMFSVSSQVDAIGQISGGPVVGAIGNRSIRAALVLSALVLSPVVPLYARAIRRTKEPGTAALQQRN
jgi:DHA3 family tetracycline resistance protein-like MFS transporter